MKDENKTKKQLIDELNEMRQMLAEYRKDTDEALRKRKERYWRIIKTAQEGIGELDAQYNITFVNTKICEMLGYEAEEMIGKSLFDFTDEENWDYIQTAVERLHQGIRGRHEMTIKCKNGKVLIITANGAPIYDAKGGNGGAFAMITDITQYKQIENELRRYQQHLEELIEGRTEELTKANQELQNEITNRKQAEDALHQSEEKFSKAFLLSPDPFSIYNLKENCYVEVNDTYLKKTGYNRQEVIGHTYQSLGIWVVPEARDLIIGQIKEQGNTCNLETKFRIKSGEIRTVLLSADIVDMGGEPYLFCLTKDITERKWMEEAIRSSEECFAKAFNASPIIMTISTLEEGRYIKVNKAFCRTTGYSDKEVIGQSSLELGFWMEPADRNVVKQRLMANQPVQDMEFWFCKNTREQRLGLYSAEKLDVHGELCVLSILMDITELRQMEVEMARWDRLNLAGEMAVSMGHEIRNPMTTVRGYLQLLRENKDYIREIDCFDLMIEELDRANSIITEFLSLAKNRVVDLKPTSLNTVISKLLPLVQAKAMSRNQHIKLELVKLPDLLLDYKQIHQLIHNLVNNAMESMPSAGEVTIRTFIEKEKVVLAVQDQGLGIDSKLLDKIGTPFFTTKEQGTGLGLAVCYRIAARHNATIDIETSSIGTTFFVRFSNIIDE